MKNTREKFEIILHQVPPPTPSTLIRICNILKTKAILMLTRQTFTHMINARKIDKITIWKKKINNIFKKFSGKKMAERLKSNLPIPDGKENRNRPR